MRIQLALNVDNLDQAINYYSKLFGAQPHKTRRGYANFAIQSPPLKLVLFENPNAKERLNHLGVEVYDSNQLLTAKSRLLANDLLNDTQIQQTCCHATQDKIWSVAPEGLRWEWYQITDDAPEIDKNASSCCSPI